ncbi:glycosyltransferase family 10 domain-containing protein [Cohnella mopanensis]|uniref:glycosyltransferase family 10 domain-containing protein n=1 Tax=Cohnella mopanensis TaxID=2911966 RepID=UPI001EF8E513|nr:glycosyltransferase family 10 [Cohnella mopanensis]
MNIAFHSIWPYESQYFFVEESSELHFGDNVWLPMVHLKNHARGYGVKLGRVTEFAIGQIDAFVFHEIPEEDDPYYQYAIENKKPMFLYNYEPVVVYAQSHDLSKHQRFVKVFTQHDYYIGLNSNSSQRKYIKFNPFCLNIMPQIRDRRKINLCTLISSNRTSECHLELYSKRKEAIKWFTENQPNDFHYFGHGWESDFNPCYKGVAIDKIETLSRYKFAICYENSRDISGYITEKILDCFRAGCVPIYWGASNIRDYIPATCYIHRNDFSSYEELYQYISTMGKKQYQEIIKEIDRFMASNQANHFSIENYVSTVWEGLMEGVAEFANKFGDLTSLQT